MNMEVGMGGGMGRCEVPTSVNKSDLHRECCWSHIHLHLSCPVLALPPQWPTVASSSAWCLAPPSTPCAPQPSCTWGSFSPTWPAAAPPLSVFPLMLPLGECRAGVPSLLGGPPSHHFLPPTHAWTPATKLGLLSFGCALGLTCHLNSFPSVSAKVLNLVNSVLL